MLRPATKVYRFGIVLLFMAVFFTLPAQAATGLNAMRALAAEGYDVAGLVVNLSSGERVAEYNADQLLSPASVTKLYTAAKALEVWGADYRFETDVLVQGQRLGPTIDGNLVLRGGGDPSFTNSGLWRLALDVAQSGGSQR